MLSTISARLFNLSLKTLGCGMHQAIATRNSTNTRKQSNHLKGLTSVKTRNALLFTLQPNCMISWVTLKRLFHVSRRITKGKMKTRYLTKSGLKAFCSVVCTNSNNISMTRALNWPANFVTSMALKETRPTVYLQKSTKSIRITIGLPLLITSTLLIIISTNSCQPTKYLSVII